jgi:predicted ATPase/class 3 adenylate cyclase
VASTFDTHGYGRWFSFLGSGVSSDAMSRPDLPTGTVTFLFTDVEGSTKLLRELGEAAYADALAEHRRVLRDAVAHQSGIEVDTEGDAIFAAFPTAPGAVSAARAAQEGLKAGPIRVRMGLHTGTPLRTAEGYVGVDVHRAARIAAAGHGGQVLISSVTATLLATEDVPLSDLGVHRLKDLAAGERIYQLGSDEHPPLRSLSPTNLPEQAGSFIGRSAELREIGELLRDPSVRLLTLVGPGGIGKSRLALQAAADAGGSFPEGRWWVPLVSVQEPAHAVDAIGRVLGLGEGSQPGEVRRRLADRSALLVLDNAEHLLPALADALAELIPAAGGSTFLITSREPLRLQAERLVRVPVMTDADAEQLLMSRAIALGAAIAPSPALTTLAERLDRLPLALNLAASRLPILSVEQILQRLSQRLDLFAGSRDADPRQRTLRATIEWSHDLLSEPERALLRRLSVFAGGWTLEAAEAVGESDIEIVASLVDRSLIQRGDHDGGPRFFMLESIRQFAAERLAASDEAHAVRARHAAWFRALAERVDEHLGAGEPEEQWVTLLNPELDNLRAAVAFGTEAGDAELVRAIAAAMPMFWIMHGRSCEGRAWIERALELVPTEDATRRRLFSGLATLAYVGGDYATATSAADAAAALAGTLGPDAGGYARLRDEVRAALMRDDLAAAEPLLEQLLVAARERDNGVGMSSCRINLAYIANRTGRHERAEALMNENLPFVRGRGQARCEATTLVTMAETLNYLDRPAAAVDFAVAAADVVPRAADAILMIEDLRWYAAAASRMGETERLGEILGACEAAESELDAALEPHEVTVREELVAALSDALTDAGLEAARARGRALDIAAATALMRAPIAVRRR